MYLFSCSREITCLIEFSAAIVFRFSLFSFTTVIASIILNGLKMKGNTTTATANAGTLQLILPALSVNSAQYWKSLFLRKHIIPENCSYKF